MHSPVSHHLPSVRNRSASRPVILLLLCLLLAACDLAPQQAKPPLAFYLEQAAPLISARRYGEAIDVLEEAVQIHPDDPAPLVAIGQIYLAQQRWSLAEDAFTRVRTHAPTNARAAAGLAEIRLAQGNWPQALRLWRQAVDLDPSLPGVFTGLGRTHLSRLAFEEARTAFARQQSAQSDPEAQWYLAALEAPRDAAAANKTLLAIPPEAPDDVLARRDYLLATLAPFTAESSPATAAQAVGIALVQAGQWPLAVHALSTAAELDAGQPAAERAETRAFLGHALAQAGRPAFDRLEQARRIDPESALPLYFFGIYLRRQQALSVAEQTFEQALALDPDNAAIYVELAQTKAEQGNLTAAEEHLKKAVELAGTNLDIRLAQVRFYAGRGYRIGEAGLPAAQALVDEHPDSAEGHDWLGWSYYLLGQPAKAEEAYRRALELDANRISARYRLGRLLAQSGRPAEARAQYQQVIDHDWQGIYREQAQEELQRLEEGNGGD